MSKKEPNQFLNVALIGYGYAGRTFHAPLISTVPGLRLATVVSSDAARVKKDWPDVFVADTPEDVFTRCETDLVVLATPNITHFDLAWRALNAGINVIVDKPFTITASEARDLIALAAARGRLLSVFHNRRWDGDYLTLCRLIAEGKLGEIAYFESRFDRYRLEVRRRWREQAGPGSGIWYDLGSHLVDQALQLFGPPEAIFADLAMQRPGASAVDYFHVVLRYRRLRAILHGSMLVPGGTPRFSVHGTRGSYAKYGLDAQEDQLKSGIRPGSPGWGRDLQDGVLIAGRGELPQSQAVPNAPGDYQAYYVAIRDALRQNAPNPVPPEDALLVMVALELGMKSSEARCEIPFSLAS